MTLLISLKKTFTLYSTSEYKYLFVSFFFYFFLIIHRLIVFQPLHFSFPFTVIISMCWVAGTIVGFLPLFGWHVKPENEAEMSCHFVKVMDYNYLVFLYFATIITPALLMLAFYTHIYRVIVKQVSSSWKKHEYLYFIRNFVARVFETYHTHHFCRYAK